MTTCLTGLKHTSLKSIMLYLLMGSIIAYGITVNTIYNTPTAINPERGSYQLDLNLYNLGGIGIKASVGLNKYIHLGLIEYVDSIIGSKKTTWHTPGILGKISFTGQGEEGWNVAIGWDTLNTGSFSEFSVPVSGPYVAVTKGFFWINESPHLVTIGNKITITEEPYRNYLFTSVLFRLLPFLDWGIEIDNVPFYETPTYHFINNQILSFNITENFTIKFVLQIAINFDTVKQTHFERINSRNFLLTYQSFF